jgi:hypothetical protein
MKFLIKFPTRNRPQKFIQVFTKYLYMLSGLHQVKFIVSMDEDDPTMNNPAMRKFLDNHRTYVQYFYGHSKTKIEAVNADMEHAGDFDILLLASDDMIPVKPGYDGIIAGHFKEYFPDFDGVMHYNDGRQRELLNTLCVMGKKYYDRFGYIYHPSYKSVYVDNEFTAVSRILKKAMYCDAVLIKHGWAEFVGFDDLMKRNEDPEMYRIDKENLEARAAKNFDLVLA